MRIELPSGAWVEVKDNMTPGDRFAVMDAAELTIEEDGRSHVRGAASAQWKTFLLRMITDWSYATTKGAPIPLAAGPQVLDDYPDLEDDDDALSEALRPRYERITRRRPTTQRQPSGTSPAS